MWYPMKNNALPLLATASRGDADSGDACRLGYHRRAAVPQCRADIRGAFVVNPPFTLQRELDSVRCLRLKVSAVTAPVTSAWTRLARPLLAGAYWIPCAAPHAAYGQSLAAAVLCYAQGLAFVPAPWCFRGGGVTEARALALMRACWPMLSGLNVCPRAVAAGGGNAGKRSS